ncbi:hypothetical protein AVEN_20343-1, partial [Araneus ventricosus]
MMRTTPELVPPLHIMPAGERLVTTYDLVYSSAHTQWIFNGIGFRTWNPPAP